MVEQISKTKAAQQEAILRNVTVPQCLDNRYSRGSHVQHNHQSRYNLLLHSKGCKWDSRSPKLQRHVHFQQGEPGPLPEVTALRPLFRGASLDQPWKLLPLERKRCVCGEAAQFYHCCTTHHNWEHRNWFLLSHSSVAA